MRGRVVINDGSIVADCDHLTVLHQHSADRYLAHALCLGRRIERDAHEDLVAHASSVTSAQQFGVTCSTMRCSLRPVP